MQFIPRLFVSEIPIVTYSNKFYNTQILKSLIKTELKNLWPNLNIALPVRTSNKT